MSFEEFIVQIFGICSILIIKSKDNKKTKIVLFSAKGKQFNQKMAYDWAHKFDRIILISSRYEGIDERFIEAYVDMEFSLGDFILSGGELAVMAFLDSAMRHVPGVLGNAESVIAESFEGDLLEHAQYTKPRDFEGKMVPEILLSGHHALIAKWQLEQRIQSTQKHRPDLFQKYMQLQNSRGKKK